MKKAKIIGIIVVIGAVVIAGGATASYAMGHNTNEVHKTTSTKNNTKNEKDTKKEESNKDAKSVQATSTAKNNEKKEDTSNNKTNKNNNESNSITWTEAGHNINVAQKSGLDTLGNEYANKVQGIVDFGVKASKEQKYQSTYGMMNLNKYMAENYVNLKDNLNSVIKKHVSESMGQALDNQDNLWQDYIKNKNAAIENNKGTSTGIEQTSNTANIQAEEVNFNIYNYLFDNGLNPQINSAYISSKLGNLGESLYSNNRNVNGQSFFYDAESKINSLQAKGNAIIDEAVKNNTSLEEAYNQVYNMWNDYLNTEYSQITNQSVYKSQIVQEETPWVNFKEEMIKTEGTAYSNSKEIALAQARMNIRLTQQQIISLLNYAPTM